MSLDGGTAETNDEIRAGCDFEKVLHNLRHAVGLRRAQNLDLRIGVSTVVLRENIDELPVLAQLVCELGLDWLKLEEGYPANLFSAQSLLRPDGNRVREAVKKVRAIVEPNGVILVDHLAPPSGCPCQATLGDALSEFRATDDFANRTCFRPCRAALGHRVRGSRRSGACRRLREQADWIALQRRLSTCGTVRKRRPIVGTRSHKSIRRCVPRVRTDGG